MEKVKILYFVDRMLRGGIQSLLIDWIKHLDKEKFKIDVLLLDDGKVYELEETLKELGCNVYKLDGIWIRKPWDFIKYSKAVDKFFKEHNDYKVVHLNSSSKNYMILKYAKKHGIPIRIAHSHNIDFQTKNPVKKLVGNLLKKSLMKYATDYFACSQLAGNWLFGKDNDRIKVIHNAIDYDKFKYNEEIRNKVRKEFNIKEKNLLIGHVGRFTNQKNHTFLIDIFNEFHKLNNNSKLLLVGIGEKQEEIKNKVNELGLDKSVIFAGFRNDANELMQGMDVFILPSLYEGLPIVGVEAQAAGLPCFMTEGTITQEVKITDNLKFISLAKSAKAWADIILNSDLTRKNTKQDLKNAGYFIEDTVDELVNFYLKRIH